jgi:hypothetical protein
LLIVSGKTLAFIGSLALIYLGFYLSRRSKRGFRIYLWVVGAAVALNTAFILAFVGS